MFEYVGLNQIELETEFSPLKFSLKTVRLKENGVPKESMSFEQVNFMTLVDEQWECSPLYKKFNETVFLFIVFQSEKIGSNEILFFKGTKVWEMPPDILNGKLKAMWSKTKAIVECGVEFTPKPSGKKRLGKIIYQA
nr:MutH/Sau3AI family endonuclease [Bacillus sp. B15-48]